MIGARSAFLLAAVLATWPIAAHADDVADGDGAFTAADVDPDPPAADPRPCFDPTDIVGYRHCPEYGEWGENLLDPYVFLQLGMNVRHFRAGHDGVAFRSAGGNPKPMADGGDSALTVDERLGFGLPHGFYLALDFEFGNFGEFDATQPRSRDVVLDGLASFGLRAALAPLSLSIEAAGGGLAYAYPTDDNYHAEAILEVRARADVWLAPWFTVGADVGTSVLRRGEWVAGVFVGFHTHSYAGDR